MSNSVIRWQTGVESDTRLAIARVAAAGRVRAERLARDRARAAHDETCDCAHEYEFCEDRP